MAAPQWQTPPLPMPKSMADNYRSMGSSPATDPPLHRQPHSTSALRPRAPSSPKRFQPPPRGSSAAVPNPSNPPQYPPNRFPPRTSSNTNDRSRLPPVHSSLNEPPRPPAISSQPPRGSSLRPALGKSKSERRLANPRVIPPQINTEPFPVELAKKARPLSAHSSATASAKPSPTTEVFVTPSSTLPSPTHLSPGFPPPSFRDGLASNTSSISINSTPALRNLKLAPDESPVRPVPRSVSTPHPVNRRPGMNPLRPREDSAQSRQVIEASSSNETIGNTTSSHRESSASQLTTGSSVQELSGTERSSVRSSESDLHQVRGWPKIREDDDDDISVEDFVDMYTDGFDETAAAAVLSEPPPPMPAALQQSPRKPSLPKIGVLETVAEDSRHPASPLLNSPGSQAPDVDYVDASEHLPSSRPVIPPQAEADYVGASESLPSPRGLVPTQRELDVPAVPPATVPSHEASSPTGNSESTHEDAWRSSIQQSPKLAPGHLTPRSSTPELPPLEPQSPPSPPKTSAGPPPMITVAPAPATFPRPSTAPRSSVLSPNLQGFRDSVMSGRMGMAPRARMVHAPVKLGPGGVSGIPTPFAAGPRTSAQIIAGLFDGDSQAQFEDPNDHNPHRDRYGFKKETQHIKEAQYNQWNLYYSKYLERRRVKWNGLMQSNGLDFENPTEFPPKSDKVKRYIRKGIPPEWRGAAWFWYAGGPQRVAKNPTLYFELSNRAEKGDMSEGDREHIERDLNRTFPDNVKFKPDPINQANGSQGSVFTSAERPASEPPETDMIKSLRRVLRSFAIDNPRIGYCQSLNFLAGQLLLFLNGDEEKAFHLLCILTSEHLPGTHGIALEGANVDIGVLMESIKDALPAVWAKLDDRTETSAGKGLGDMRTSSGLPTVSLATTAWFMSCFIGTLPVETACRVWDCLFYEGSKTLFRVALGIFKLNEDEIRRLRDPMEVFQLVQMMPRRLIDANALMEGSFGRSLQGRGLMSQDAVERLRSERRVMYKTERERALFPPPVPEDEKPRRGLSRKGTLRRLKSKRIKVPS